jgi:hypothetical protein
VISQTTMQKTHNCIHQHYYAPCQIRIIEESLTDLLPIQVHTSHIPKLSLNLNSFMDEHGIKSEKAIKEEKVQEPLKKETPSRGKRLIYLGKMKRKNGERKQAYDAFVDKYIWR